MLFYLTVPRDSFASISKKCLQYRKCWKILNYKLLFLNNDIYVSLGFTVSFYYKGIKLPSTPSTPQLSLQYNIPPGILFRRFHLIHILLHCMGWFIILKGECQSFSIFYTLGSIGVKTAFTFIKFYKMR